MPPFQLNSNFNHSENQDHTQLTSGGLPAPGEFNIGDRVDGTYEVLSLIGSGGMGHVYRVRHTMMNQEYALKALSAEQVNEVAWRRFQNEAQAIARMSQPNIVAIYNLGLHENRLPYYVMDLVVGDTLMDHLRKAGRPSLHATLQIFCEVAAGMAYAHRKGIVHRDIKPANILLLKEGTYSQGSARVKIVDFGIAKLSGIKDQANQSLTGMGEICGSPFYMSPEQCTGGRVDARSDIYSFGCTLFEALTGQPPFRGRNAVETMLMHQNATPPSLRSITGQKYPAMLEQAMATMLAKVPMDRYQNMERIIQDFGVLLEGKDEAIRPFISQSETLTETQRLTKKKRIDQEQEEKRQEPLAAKARRVGMVVLATALGAAVITGGVMLYKVLAPSSTAQHQSSSTFFRLVDDPAKGKPKAVAATSSSASAAATSQPISVQSKSIALKPFSHNEERDGKKLLVFDFPPGVNLGTLRTIGVKQNIPATGHIEYPADVILELVPDESALTDPEILGRFRRGDIARVHYSTGLDGSNDTVKAISKIEGVKDFQIRLCDKVDDKCLPDLAKMTDLEDLRLQVTSITGHGVASLPVLKNLRTLVVHGCDDADYICKALENSPKLAELDLQDSRIDSAGVKSLSTIKGLRALTISSDRLSDEDLKELAKLPRLQELSALSCGIKPKQAPILRSFPRLKILLVHSLRMNTRDFIDLQRALPMMRVQ